jgi:diphosphomevalonate decarboxylase
MKIRVSAPSNIALIKYMGKTDVSSNIPSNASISYTVDHLKTWLEITKAETDSWQELPGYYPLQLSEKGKNKFLTFFAKLKLRLRIDHNFMLRSANTFPSDAGLASSASSFAALTKGAWELCKLQHGSHALKILLQDSDDNEITALAKLSRLGSGSSCRSFMSGFCLWDKTEVRQVTLPYEKLYHIAFLLEEGKKPVSSSEAHLRVMTSKNMEGRTHRAEDRLQRLMSAFETKNWYAAREIVWDEFIDMHSLFETSHPPFSFMNLESRILIEELRLDKHGPLITMDAGPNVHLFFYDQVQFEDYKQRYSNYKILVSE